MVEGAWSLCGCLGRGELGRPFRTAQGRQQCQFLYPTDTRIGLPLEGVGRGKRKMLRSWVAHWFRQRYRDEEDMVLMLQRVVLPFAWAAVTKYHRRMDAQRRNVLKIWRL